MLERGLMATKQFSSGDWVIYRKTKFSAHPGPRARNVAPTARGDNYVYNVDKFWIVLEIRSDQTIRVMTRRGKEQLVNVADPNLRRANWWERMRNRSRFQPIVEALSQNHFATEGVPTA